MRAFALLIAALPLAGCAARDAFVQTSYTGTASGWKLERQPDPITGAAVSSAVLMTGDSANANEPMPRAAMLQLTCFRDQPMVVFAFRFKIGTNPNSYLGYRFDEKPGRDINATFMQQHDKVVIEDPFEVAEFARTLAGASVLHVRIRSLNAGRTTATFQVAGAEQAIKAGFAACPLPAEPPRRGRTS